MKTTQTIKINFISENRDRNELHVVAITAKVTQSPRFSLR